MAMSRKPRVQGIEPFDADEVGEARAVALLSTVLLLLFEDWKNIRKRVMGHGNMLRSLN